MPNDFLPITPAVLTWARERAGLTLEEAEGSFKKIREWETGDSAPTYPQLEKLSDKLGLPVAGFFLSEPPVLPSIRESFRTLPDAEYFRMPPVMLALLRRAKAMQLNLAELCDGVNPAEHLITRDVTLIERLPLRDAAERIRAFLGVPLEQQFSWRDADTALKAWRGALQRVGIFVFKDAFRADDYSGFSLYDDLFPVIFINNSNSKTRQIFTLFHELAHLLIHTSGIDTPDERQVHEMHGHDRELEIFCNSLAAKILMPDAAFLTAVGAQPHSEHTAVRIADQFSVSREMVYRQFLERRWITNEAYSDAVQRWSAQLQRGSGEGGDYYWTKIAYLGDQYIALALKRHAQNQIDENRLSEYLDVKPRNVAALTEHFERTAR